MWLKTQVVAAKKKIPQVWKLDKTDISWAYCSEKTTFSQMMAVYSLFYKYVHALIRRNGCSFSYHLKYFTKMQSPTLSGFNKLNGCMLDNAVCKPMLWLCDERAEVSCGGMSGALLLLHFTLFILCAFLKLLARAHRLLLPTTF